MTDLTVVLYNTYISHCPTRCTFPSDWINESRSFCPSCLPLPAAGWSACDEFSGRLERLYFGLRTGLVRENKAVCGECVSVTMWGILRPWWYLENGDVISKIFEWGLVCSIIQGHKDFWKTSKPCHVGIHWIALPEYSHMSTHSLGFQTFLRFFASFCIGKISHRQHEG